MSVKAAAERHRKNAHHDLDDLELLADWAAEQLLGGEEPITEEWLRSLKIPEFPIPANFCLTFAVTIVYELGHWVAMCDDQCLVILQTRADVLRLAAALGISLPSGKGER